jgi:hypothetical protein
MPVRSRSLSSNRMNNGDLSLAGLGLTEEGINVKVRGLLRLLLVIAGLTALTVPAQGQALADPEDSSGVVASTTAAQPDLTYMRPTQAMKLHNYVLDMFGPYPIAGVALAAGVNQAYNAPPEWKQGAEGYSKRFGSNFGIEAVSTTTRYALAEVFKEDTLYYPCECKGLFPQLRHAVVSTVTARRGQDGHTVFSFPALVAPYAGTMTAVYGWYPTGYDAKDAFRMGNYTLLVYAGGNIAREFIYGGPHSLFHRTHVNNGHGARNPGLNP